MPSTYCKNRVSHSRSIIIQQWHRACPCGTRVTQANARDVTPAVLCMQYGIEFRLNLPNGGPKSEREQDACMPRFPISPLCLFVCLYLHRANIALSRHYSWHGDVLPGTRGEEDAWPVVNGRHPCHKLSRVKSMKMAHLQLDMEDAHLPFLLHR